MIINISVTRGNSKYLFVAGSNVYLQISLIYVFEHQAIFMTKYRSYSHLSITSRNLPFLSPPAFTGKAWNMVLLI